ncbi:hypothetical protein [Nostoc linckia]|nr:hypothetical protein [Nostoc linckia]
MRRWGENFTPPPHHPTPHLPCPMPRAPCPILEYAYNNLESSPRSFPR